MGTFSIWHWLVVLLVVVLVFGAKKVGDAGGHIGKAVHDFKKSMREGGKTDGDKAAEGPAALEAGDKSGAASATAEKTAAS